MVLQFTNIQKKFFKKKDFNPAVSKKGLKKELKAESPTKEESGPIAAKAAVSVA